MFSCASENNNNYKKPNFSSKGFAYIYTEKDYINKINKKKN